MSKTTIHSFVPIQKLGEGTFSSVYKVRRISDNKIYALKKIKMASLKEKEKINALNQIRILASLSSEHIVTYKQAFFDEQLKLLCIVMECANQGDLLQKISKAKNARSNIEERQIWKAIYQVLTGLLTLHQHNILHRDLKSANIFVNDSNYKIGDLNVSKINADQKLVKTQTGTPYYASPQIWRDQPYSYTSDLWSFGCIIYEMCCFQPPFQGHSLDQLFKNVQKGHFPRIPENYSCDLMQIIAKCLTLKAQKRPSAQQLLKIGGIVLSKCDYYQIKTNKDQKQTVKQPLLSTINMPYDLNKLNTKLPDSKYELEEKKTNSIPAKPAKIYKLSQIKENKFQANDSKNMQNKLKNNEITKSKEKQNLPLPERIRNHLKGISEKNNDDSIPHRRPKNRIQTALSRPQNMVLHQKLPNFNNIVPSVSTNKRRPYSCNIKTRFQTKLVNNRPYSGLQQKNKKILPFQQQKNGFNCLQRVRVEHRGKNHTQIPCGRYNQRRINKQRCQSAIINNNSSLSRQPTISSYLQISKRLENRQRQMQYSGSYLTGKNNSSVNKAHLQQNEIKTRQNSSLLPPILSKQVYLRKNKVFQESSLLDQKRAYLMQIQNKILTNCTSKQKKCAYSLNSQGMSLQQSKLKQLLKRQPLFQQRFNV